MFNLFPAHMTILIWNNSRLTNNINCFHGAGRCFGVSTWSANSTSATPWTVAHWCRKSARLSNFRSLVRIKVKSFARRKGKPFASFSPMPPGFWVLRRGFKTLAKELASLKHVWKFFATNFLETTKTSQPTGLWQFFVRTCQDWIRTARKHWKWLLQL